MKKSNYTVTQERMAAAFCGYDQQKMIDKFGLGHDEAFLYIEFFSHPYRINRADGKVERCAPTVSPAGFDEAMSIYDFLCCSKDDCRLTGKFFPVNSLRGAMQTASVGGSIHGKYAALFDRHPRALEQALALLSGEKADRGDIACKLYAFPQLPLLFRFWHADEDFPASVQLLWDENTLDFLHYETTYYVAGHLLEQLKQQIEEFTK